MKKKLSLEQFLRARDYLMSHGRDIEQQLFRYYFEHGSSGHVINALKNYQGEDGGFRNLGEGHAVITNVMDTSMAFQYLSEVGATINDEIVQKGINYLIAAYDHEHEGWQGRPYQQNRGWLDNPCAELVGYLYEYRELVPVDFLTHVTEKAISCMVAFKDSDDEYYFLDALCLLRLAVRIDEPHQTKILEMLANNIPEIIETNREKWATTYCAKPFFFAHSPNSPLFLRIQHDVIRSLENEIDTQAEDGHFVLNWHAIEESAVAWKSIWTMDALRAFQHHHMIETKNTAI